MSSYCIVYSIHSEDKNINDLLQWREFLYSINTLRKFNKDVPVKLYVSPPDRVWDISRFPDTMENLTIIPVSNPVSNNVLGDEVAKRLDMKFHAAFDALENSDYDRVLMIDPDTIYFDNPDLIFNKYTADYMYATTDYSPDFFNLIKTNKLYMNDGIVIVPRWTLNMKDELLSARDKWVVDKAEELKDILTDEDHIWRNSLGWSASQYGIYDFLQETSKPVMYFDPRDVANLSDWEMGCKSPVLLHYWHIGYHEHLPAEYKDGILDYHMTTIHAKV